MPYSSLCLVQRQITRKTCCNSRRIISICIKYQSVSFFIHRLYISIQLIMFTMRPPFVTVLNASFPLSPGPVVFSNLAISVCRALNLLAV